jgi:hypothetical protein
MAEVNLGRIAKAFEQPAYVAIGYGVLGFQRAQVYRRSWEHRVSKPEADQATAASVRSEMREHPGPLRGTLNDIAGEVLEHLPTEAHDLLKAVGDLAGDLPREARGIVDEAVAVARFALRFAKAPASRRPYP